jgi:transcriptional regulator of arginine metabolism
MRNKKDRLQTIRNLVGNKKISSQEDLLKLMIAHGFKMTQATLSRDLRDLKISKIRDTDDTYIYIHQDQDSRPSIEIKSGFPLNGFLSMQFAQGIALIRTLPGFASGIASAIDTMKIKEIAGTIAGDDTILLIPMDGTRKEEIVKKLSSFIPEIKTKLL